MDDLSAIGIRNFLMDFDYKKDMEYFVPVDAFLEWKDELKRTISLEIYVNNKVYVTIVLWGIVTATICMSESGC